MSFQSNDLSVLAYANGFTLWHYKSNDTATQIETANYFKNASDMLRVNDLIISNIDVDGTPSTKIYIVTVNSSSTLTIAAFTA